MDGRAPARYVAPLHLFLFAVFLLFLFPNFTGRHMLNLGGLAEAEPGPAHTAAAPNQRGGQEHGEWPRDRLLGR